MTKSDIQLIRSLGDKRARSETGLFVVEGRKSVDEFRASGLKVVKEYVIPPRHGARTIAAKGLNVAKEYVIPTRAQQGEGSHYNIEYISSSEMSRISHLKTPADRLALVEIPRWKFEPAGMKNRIVLALDEVQNPGNVGTIIRLADWFGVSDMLCSEGSADCFSPKVVQATMGALTRVRVHYGDLPAMISQVVDATRMPVYGTFLEGENIYETSLSKDGVVVFGSEGRGISDAVAATVSRRLLIPARNPRAESLNVAVAAGIVCSQFLK